MEAKSSWDTSHKSPLFRAEIDHKHDFFHIVTFRQWRSKVVGTLVKTVQKITKESFSTTIVIFKGTV